MAPRKSSSAFFPVVVAALAGNYVGGRLRARAGRPVQTLRFHHVDARGHTYRAAPLLTQFLPAVFLARLGRPNWFFAFLGGVASVWFLGDDLEKRWVEWLGERIEARRAHQLES